MPIFGQVDPPSSDNTAGEFADGIKQQVETAGWPCGDYNDDDGDDFDAVAGEIVQRQNPVGDDQSSSIDDQFPKDHELPPSNPASEPIIQDIGRPFKHFQLTVLTRRFRHSHINSYVILVANSKFRDHSIVQIEERELRLGVIREAKNQWSLSVGICAMIMTMAPVKLHLISRL